MSGAVEEAAPPPPVESEIGKLVERIKAGETVIVRGAPNPQTGRPRRYRLKQSVSTGRLAVSYRVRPGVYWPVNNDEWDIATRGAASEAMRLEHRARAVLAAIFAGIPVCDFECGKTINSYLGFGIVPRGQN